MLQKKTQTFNEMVREAKDAKHWWSKRRTVMVDMEPGRDRQRAIVKYLTCLPDDETYARIWVNRHGCSSVPRDKDIQRLIKDGIVKIAAVRSFNNVKHQYLVLVENEQPSNK